MVWITGATGFIGSQISRSFAAAGLRPQLLIDLVPPEDRPRQWTATCGFPYLSYEQFMNHTDWNALEKPSWVVHMGAISATTEKNWELLRERNVDCTKRLFSWCTSNQIPLIYASSAATYGNGDVGYDDQTNFDLLQPLNLYGRSKLMVDQWAVTSESAPPHWYGLRFFNVYGPGEYYKNEMASVVYKAFHEIQTSGKLRLFKSYRDDYSHGEQKRDFIYVKEIADWILELMTKKPKSGVYNMGTGRARSWLELARAVFSAMNKPVTIDFIEMPESLRPQYQYFTEASMAKWTGVNLSPPHWDLSEGVLDYYQEYKQHEL